MDDGVIEMEAFELGADESIKAAASCYDGSGNLVVTVVVAGYNRARLIVVPVGPAQISTKPSRKNAHG